ncbi:MAG TPA: MliC family protein [Candidatus Paceibacterota bacterium]|nr:MliC family protein [Candidatus Paceibacterota bacterium]
MKTRNVILVLAVIAVIVVGVIALPKPPETKAPTVEEAASSTGMQPAATAVFTCAGGKTIAAAFYDGSSTPSTDPSKPPIPGGSVKLELSDGRTMTLPQAVSADGARYANADESVVFWNVGDTATMTEHGTTTFAGCTAAPPSTE